MHGLSKRLIAFIENLAARNVLVRKTESNLQGGTFHATSCFKAHSGLMFPIKWTALEAAMYIYYESSRFNIKMCGHLAFCFTS